MKRLIKRGLRRLLKNSDLVNRRFGKLVVVKFFGCVLGKRQWECVCDCGGEIIVCTTDLRSGKTRSCGCGRGI